MKKIKYVISILLILLIITIILLPIRKKYFTDEGRISRFILNDLDIIIEEFIIEDLKKSNISLLEIDEIDDYQLYYVHSLRSWLHGDALSRFSVDNYMIYHPGLAKIKPKRYSVLLIYGVKNNNVYTIEYLLINELINIDIFIDSLKEFDKTNNTYLSIEEHK